MPYRPPTWIRLSTRKTLEKRKSPRRLSSREDSKRSKKRQTKKNTTRKMMEKLLTKREKELMAKQTDQLAEEDLLREIRSFKKRRVDAAISRNQKAW